MNSDDRSFVSAASNEPNRYTDERHTLLDLVIITAIMVVIWAIARPPITNAQIEIRPDGSLVVETPNELTPEQLEALGAIQTELKMKSDITAFSRDVLRYVFFIVLVLLCLFFFAYAMLSRRGLVFKLGTSKTGGSLELQTSDEKQVETGRRHEIRDSYRRSRLQIGILLLAVGLLIFTFGYFRNTVYAGAATPSDAITTGVGIIWLAFASIVLVWASRYPWKR